MPFNDTVFEDWTDCVWQDWDDCEWDKFSSRDRTRKTRTSRLLIPQAMGDYGRRPQLEGNPGYVEDMKKYPDKAFADAKLSARGEEVRHLVFKQPYRYETMQKMKYKDEPALPHQKIDETPMGIVAGKAEYEWKWVRYFDDSRWTPTTGQWFDNRWLEASSTGWGTYLDDTYWEPRFSDHATWNGTAWVFNPAKAAPGLSVIGSWATDFRPTHIKVTWDTDADWLYVFDGSNFQHYGTTTYTSGTSAALDWSDQNGHVMTDIYDLGIGFYGVTITVTNIEFYPAPVSGLDISVLGDWYKDLRPKKFRMKFDNATADVSLKDSNAVEIYASGTYASGDEVYLDFAGADIDNLVVSGSGDVTDIEFYERVKKNPDLGSNQRTPNKTPNIPATRAKFPDPNPIQGSERLARHPNLRTTKGE